MTMCLDFPIGSSFFPLGDYASGMRYLKYRALLCVILFYVSQRASAQLGIVANCAPLLAPVQRVSYSFFSVIPFRCHARYLAVAQILLDRRERTLRGIAVTARAGCLDAH